MKQTKYLKLNKPEATDFYNINDFNQNADKLDAAAKNCDDRLSFLETRLRDIRASVDIHAFADMKPVLGAERDVWNNASVQYSPIGGSWVFSCENISILAEYNTSEVIGTIREPRQRQFILYGESAAKRSDRACAGNCVDAHCGHQKPATCLCHGIRRICV